MVLSKTMRLMVAGGAAWCVAAAPVPGLRVALPAHGGAPTYGVALQKLAWPKLEAASHAQLRFGTLPPEGSSKPWDVTVLDPEALAVACADGEVRRRDARRAAEAPALLPLAGSACGTGAYLRAVALGWDPRKLPLAPSWGDFWNVVRFPGQRALPCSARYTLEIALMSDGVAPRDVYAVLGTKDGVERAFRRLDQLRPYVVWWKPGTNPMQMVAQGQALMAAAPNEDAIEQSRALRHDFGLQWNEAIIAVHSWAIATDSGAPQAAAALILASSDPVLQSEVTELTGLGGTDQQDADARTLGQVLAGLSPTAHLGQALVFDGGFWREHGSALDRRFEQWMSK